MLLRITTLLLRMYSLFAACLGMSKIPTSPSGFMVATHMHQVAPCPHIPEGKLFEFTGYDRMMAS